MPQTVSMDLGETMPGAGNVLCSCCGGPLPAGNLAWDVEEPDPLAFLTDAQRARQVAAQTPQIVTAKGLGNFIRVILPVPVEHDRVATFGVWLNMPELREWKRVIKAASRGGDAWAGVRFAGRLTTAVQPWPETFGAWVQAVVPGPKKVPHIVHSVDPLLARVLADRWPEELIRSARNAHVPQQMAGGPTPDPYRRPLWQRLVRGGR